MSRHLYRPRAYAQGELDYLCGAYAVVNAVRHTVGPVRRFGGAECLWLFGRLVEELARRRLLAAAMTEGMNQRHVGLLLRVSRKALSARYGLRLAVYKPFHCRSRVRRRKLLKVVRRHLAGTGTAALIGLGEHWSVIQRITPTGFRMLDSFEYHNVQLDSLIVRRPVDADREEREWIRPSSVHLLRLRDK